MVKNLLRAALTLTVSAFIVMPVPVQAISGSDFTAGRIIDDSVFFNGNDLTATQVQQFLESKVPVCDTNGTQLYGGITRAAYGDSRGYPAPYTCLRDYSSETQNKAAETGLCEAYTGGTKSAAQIIHDVGQACGINPKVLLVLLQKEQGLVTDDWPWSIQYRSATGYGCPDTEPCFSEYYGFFNQVYSAARQFKRYARDNNLFSYKVNRDNYIRYNPNSACGGSNVYIQNQATAGLYNYTPYQPNGASLANLYGTGDSCSAYGNRNFWRMYTEWFGSTFAPVLVPSASLKLNGTDTTIVAYGSNVTMSWTTQNVSNCSITPGNFSGASGQVTLQEVTQTTTHAISCTGQYGTANTSATFTVSPPTFSYLKDYLTSSAQKSGINPSQVKGITQQVSQAEKYFAEGNKTEAEQLLNHTVSNMNKLAGKDKMQPQYAASYKKAVDTLIASWNVVTPPPPTPIVNGGYPSKWADVPRDSVIDNWGMYNRESTSYSAFKVFQSGRSMPYWGGRGNPNQWDDNARASGIPVDTTPKVGDVAISNSGYYGHAMYVESINSDGTFNVSQYNAQSDGNYSVRNNVPITGLVFIHFPYPN